MVIRICVIFNELVKGEQALFKGIFQIGSRVCNVVGCFQQVGQRMAHDAFVGSGGPNRFRNLLKSLLFCSEEAEFVLSDIRTAFINGAGVGGVFYQRADDRFGQIEAGTVFCFQQDPQRLCIALKIFQISDHLLG